MSGFNKSLLHNKNYICSFVNNLSKYKFIDLFKFQRILIKKLQNETFKKIVGSPDDDYPV